MAFKRSRATFEADLQAQQSPYAIYGTPLPPLDPDSRDDGSFVPIWKQEVTDEQGRKRLHGAFTGGFSAGYFNTVGSKEGWTPSAFVSSRSDRKKDGIQSQQRPEDFMDEEDLAEAEETSKLQTVESFAGLGSTHEPKTEASAMMDILSYTGETMGVKLLKKMGWREGQGTGPKVRRKARTDEDLDMHNGDEQETHLFAPKDSNMISFMKKADRKGLGFSGKERFNEATSRMEGDRPQSTEEEDQGGGGEFGSVSKGNKMNKKKMERKGGFGVGILNDNGSDDEDPYAMGPQISYNRTIGGDKKKKKKVDVVRPAANPLLQNKPVFISKKAGASKPASGFRRCHDGRLPLHGFVLSSDSNPLSSIVSQDGKYPPPTIPPDWKTSKISSSAQPVSDLTDYQSSAAIAAASKLSPKSRAALLGEKTLPGKSVFDFLTPGARSRIASATKNDNLPPALSEASTPGLSSSRTLKSLVPPLACEIAQTALGRGTAGWMPYAEDLAKRARYRKFLEIHAGLSPEGTLPDRAPDSSNDDWVNEMKEFAHAAQIFKPMTGAMASRFTSSSSAPKLASDNLKQEEIVQGSQGDSLLLTEPMGKKKTPAEEAAAVGMYGPLTRSVQNFYPTRLLCKRFNIQPPAHVQIDPSGAPPGSEGGQGLSKTLPQRSLELVGKGDMNNLRMVDGAAKHNVGNGMEDVENDPENRGSAGHERERAVLIDPERNEALEKERPGEAVFKAIFGSDDEEED